MRPSLLAATVLALLIAPAPSLAAQGAKQTSSIDFARRAQALKAGEWVWAPDISPTGPVVVYVDLSRQLADIYRNGVRIGVSTVSTGKPGHETPTGVFKILQKDRNHHSAKYNNAPMFFQQRLTWDGVALHAGGLPGYPESHGCVHLPYKLAEQLFATTTMGGTVIVQGRAGSPVKLPAAGVLSPASAGGLPSGYRPLDSADWRWTPEVSPDGPVSIVMSTGDERMVVLRNGKEIGRSKIHANGIASGAHVATLVTDSGGRHHWSLIALPGQTADDHHSVDTDLLAQVRIPRDFLDRLRPVLATGTHVLMTPAALDARSTAVPITVVSATD